MPHAQDLEDPKVELIKIGSCSYRKLTVPDDLSFFKTPENRYFDEEEDEIDGELDDQMTYESDEWVLRLPIAAVFHKFIVGARARNKQKLEMETGARIVVPKREDNDDAVYLRARQKQMIYSAKAQIELLCEKEETKLEYTHFLSVPLAHDAKLRQAADQFREDVVLQRFPGIDASIFMQTRRVHFTICMLKLHSHAQVNEMKQAMEEIAARVAALTDYDSPLTAQLKGLHILTDDPTSVSVVYTTDRSHALQNRIDSMANMIFDVLKARNLASAQNLMAQRLLSSDGNNAEIKLHATLMNTKYSKTSWREEGAPRSERETFDASALMERFGQVDFGAVPMRELQLSCLDEMGDDGYYRSLSALPLCNPAAFQM